MGRSGSVHLSGIEVEFSLGSTNLLEESHSYNNEIQMKQHIAGDNK